MEPVPAAAGSTKVREIDVKRGALASTEEPPLKRRRSGENAVKGAEMSGENETDEHFSDLDDGIVIGQKGPALDATRESFVSAADSIESMTEEQLRATVAARLEGLKHRRHYETEVIEENGKKCTHEVAMPRAFFGDDELPANLRPGELLKSLPAVAEMARTYAFELDPFQKASVSCVERGESVLVSAHTSAGKTVVAEYAIAQSLKHNQRVIYTSPIKALSNQKYRELFEEFHDVGLMTGDITINPTASCLVMTTEILRSMLYRGSEIVREVAWVIFDEIHYMRDKERGVVWEETIIMLPHKVRFVFLSATIPNAREFAAWIASVHEQPCHVVYTDHRPTPLQHYVFPSGGAGLYLAVNEKGKFREENFQKALASMAAGAEKNKSGGSSGRRGRQQQQQQQGSDCQRIIKMIMEKNYSPTIVFSFSKRECEALALQMSKMDFTESAEKDLIETIYANALDSLTNPDDRVLPQVVHILPLLKLGIGIHHSGLLPILKEVIEILFQEGLIKVLFSTETFSMGLNMPAKTVVFTSVRKFDGKTFRYVTSGEYIQMSGRAGRRGLDDKGIVIMMLDEQMDPPAAKEMMHGESDPLYSSFHIGYNMLLNLLRIEEVDPEFMLQRSFHQFQVQQQVPELERRIRELETQRDEIRQGLTEVLVPASLLAYSSSSDGSSARKLTVDPTQVEKWIGDAYEVDDQLRKYVDAAASIQMSPKNAKPFLNPGRLVFVQDSKNVWGWGVVVNFSVKSGVDRASNAVTGEVVVVDTLLRVSSDTSDLQAPSPPTGEDAGRLEVVPVLLPLIRRMSSLRLVMPKDLRPAASREAVEKGLRGAVDKFHGAVPELDPVKDMKISSEDFANALRRRNVLQTRLEELRTQAVAEILPAAASEADRMHVAQRFDQALAEWRKVAGLENSIFELQKLVKASASIILTSELRARKRVLRRLGFVSDDDVIQVKGRVSCEINAADEIVLTEMIFAGVFSELSPPVCVALASCFVFHEKSTDTKFKLSEELAEPYRRLQETAKRVCEVSREAKLENSEYSNEEEYLAKFSPHLMEICLAWCNGAKFSEISSMTDIFEGSIIRAMRRLEELLRQLSSAAKTIGNAELEAKFAEGIELIKRDIVFAASLYL